MKRLHKQHCHQGVVPYFWIPMKQQISRTEILQRQFHYDIFSSNFFQFKLPNGSGKNAEDPVINKLLTPFSQAEMLITVFNQLTNHASDELYYSNSFGRSLR